MDVTLSLTLYHFNLGAQLKDVKTIEADTAKNIFNWFKTNPLFNWRQSHNFCEARAEAISLLLHAAGIDHAKAWVFGAAFLQQGYVGGLKNNWNYHVAIALPVMENNQLTWMVLDPAINDLPVVLADWAASITAYPHSYHFLKEPNYYIFPERKLNTQHWHKREKRNFRWTMQGLMGIHSLHTVGKAKLAFKKSAIEGFTKKFMQSQREMVEAGKRF